MIKESIREIFHIEGQDSDITNRLFVLSYLEKEEDTKEKGLDVLYEIINNPQLVLQWSVLADEEPLFPWLTIDLDCVNYDKAMSVIKKEIENKKENALKDEFSDLFKLIFMVYRLYISASEDEKDEKELEEIYEVMKTLGVDNELKRLIVSIYSLMISPRKNVKCECRNGWETFLEHVVRKLMEKDEWISLDSCYFLCALQLVVLVQCLENANGNKKEIVEDTLCIAAGYVANRCYEKDWNKEGIRFAKMALNVEEYEKRQDAFNILGLCAIDDNQLQLAYDCYFSWINRKMVLKINNAQSLEKKLNSRKEEMWRVGQKECVATMYGNYAYVCGTMYDLLRNRGQYLELMILAEYYIKKAVELGEESKPSTNFYCSAGTILSDVGKNEEAICFYEQYKESAERYVEKINASRYLILEYRSFLRQKEKIREEQDTKYQEVKNKLNVEINTFVDIYQQLDKMKYKNKEVLKELRNGRNIYTLMSKCHDLSRDREKVRYLLLQISRDIYDILERLRRCSVVDYNYQIYVKHMSTEVKAIIDAEKEHLRERLSVECKERIEHRDVAFYTTLNNAKYLFKEVQPESEKDSSKSEYREKKNCFTMMHAKYMNDPEEGLVLLQDIKEYLPNRPEEMRDELYDKKYVFIRSFTGLIDQLNMWTLYGSDKSSGKDCNGCCVCFAPETFDVMINHSENGPNESAQKNSRDEDDYHLYSIAYIDGEDIIVDGKRDEKIKEYYEQLKNHLAELDRIIKSFLEKDKKIISSCLVTLLEKITFLFKDSSYSMEEESRLIVTRDILDRQEIGKTDEIPQKLFINPFYQIYPEKIILGPKIENADYWMPYFQYELAGIKEKWSDGFTREFKPIVRKSKINIR